MDNKKLKSLIAEQVDPDELIDILRMNTEQLLYYLNDPVEEAIESGHFEYLEIMKDDAEAGEDS